MDITQFDRITETIAQAPNRRDVLRLLGAAFGVGGLTLLASTEGEAKRRRKSKKRKKKQGSTQNPGPTGPTGPICTDGIKNGSESDVDCGGTCPRCATGKTCASRNDCASARCEAGTCQTCVNNVTDCGTDSDGSQCACRDHESGQRFCTKSAGRLLPPGTPCTACQGGEQCFPVNGGAGGIECILPCGA